MKNKPSLWVLAAGAIAFLLVVAYLIFALTLADLMKSDLVPPDKATSYVYALIEADRTPYTEHVVDTPHKAGLADAIEHRRDESDVSPPTQFLLEPRRFVTQKTLKFSFRLASTTPSYVWNGATTDFERKGLDTVAGDPLKPYGGFIGPHSS